jgi:hypothetical protein
MEPKTDDPTCKPAVVLVWQRRTAAQSEIIKASFPLRSVLFRGAGPPRTGGVRVVCGVGMINPPLGRASRTDTETPVSCDAPTPASKILPALCVPAQRGGSAASLNPGILILGPGARSGGQSRVLR